MDNNIIFLGLDIGYNGVKGVMGDSTGRILKKFKFSSAIAELELSEHAGYTIDEKVLRFEGKSFYVGDEALKMETSKIIDIVDYSNLELFGPLLQHKAIQLAGITPNIIVVGLSICQLDNSKYFEDRLKKYNINDKVHEFTQVAVFPQGLACKLTIDRYGIKFPLKDSNFYQDYVGCDIGFNTLDIFKVIDGKSSSSLLHGIENEGFIKLAKDVQKSILENYGKEYKLKEVSKIIEDGFIRVKGVPTNVSNIISSSMNKYIIGLQELINKTYGESLDSTNNLIILGGGSSAFHKYNKLDNFIISPKEDFEYYNSIGFYLLGLNRLLKNK